MTATIDRYEIRRKLGQGGMASVYLAYDPRFNREVAIKVLPREFLHDPVFRARFEREAQVIAALEHLAIVPVYDFGEHEGQPYLVMRYMAGGSLADRLRRGPLALAEVARILSALAPALDKAHRSGVVHRDLKPGNILFDADGNLAIADFGIAKLAEASGSYTGTGIIGTPAYMSPEQVEAERSLDGRSDVYSLGVILYELLAGKPPYDADTPMGLALMHLRKPVPHVREVVPGLPPAVDQVISTALAKEREERYRTATALANAFSVGLQGSVLPPTLPMTRQELIKAAPAGVSTPALVADQPADRNSRRRSAWILVPLGLVTAGLIAVMAVLGDARDNDGTLKPTMVTVGVAVVALKQPTELVTIQPPIATPTPVSTRAPTSTAMPKNVVLTDKGAIVTEPVRMELVRLPAGEFLMGSDPAKDSEADSVEQPQHRVMLAEFYIGKYEVTNSQYATFVKATGHTAPDDWQAGYLPTGEEEHPVVNVSWDDATAFTQWLGGETGMGFRLCTDAEWEKACRGTSGWIYPWGDTFDVTKANTGVYDSGIGATRPVGQYSPGGDSPYGLADMVGNVREWVADWCCRDYSASSSVDNPSGPETGENRVLRGGSYASASEGKVRCAIRWVTEAGRGDKIGFRVCVSPDVSTDLSSPTNSATLTIASPSVGYQFVTAGPVRHDSGCPTALIGGTVRDGAGNPLRSVRLWRYDQWGNEQIVESNASDADPGRYVLPLDLTSNVHYVQVVDAGGVIISPVVEIQHRQGEAPEATCHWLDWVKR